MLSDGAGVGVGITRGGRGGCDGLGFLRSVSWGRREVRWCVRWERVAHFRGLVQFAKIVEWSVGLGGERRQVGRSSVGGERRDFMSCVAR